jgi:predicted small metal-binding protein
LPESGGVLAVLDTLGQPLRGGARKGVNADMRAMECPLEGHHLEAENDEELFKVTRKHADEVHPEQGFTDEQLRSIIAENVYDK